MNSNFFSKKSMSELINIANDLDIKTYKNKTELISKILKCFHEFEQYQKNSINKYEILNQLGNIGKEGITYLVKKDKNTYAMKTFNKKKSIKNIQKEAILQQKASELSIAPKIYEVDLVNNYIIMEKMDCHLVDIMKKQNGDLTEIQQKQIINLFQKLDESKVFHGDSNILNYMYKGQLIYIIDFGMSDEINEKLIKKLQSNKPNYEIMNLGFILKLKELKCPQSAYKYLLKHVSKENKIKYGLE